MKYRDFTKILEGEGFEWVPKKNPGSHQKMTGFVDGKRQVVTISGQPNDDIMRRNLASMIRQSGLSKKLFRK